MIQNFVISIYLPSTAPLAHSLTTPDLNIFLNGSFHLAQTARASHASLHRNKKPAEAGFLKYK